MCIEIDWCLHHSILYSFHSDLNRLQTLRDDRRKRKKKFYIVTEDWIRECIEEGTLTSERSHEPV